MKTRSGFVSNSSSSSFFFCFAAKPRASVAEIKLRCQELIVKHAKYFDLSNQFAEGRFCHAADIFRIVDTRVLARHTIAKPCDDDHYVVDIKTQLALLREELKFWEKELQKKQNEAEKAKRMKKPSDSYSYERDILSETKKTTDEFERVFNSGKTTAVKLELGDHHGMVGDAAETMDYAFVPFNEEDLAVIRISNH